MKVKSLLLGGLVASTVPFFVSQSYTLYYLALHHDDPGMTEAKAVHILHHHFPGKQLLWVCDLVAAVWVLPVVFVSSLVKVQKRKPVPRQRRVRYVGAIKIPSEIGEALTEVIFNDPDVPAFLRAHVTQ